MPERLDERVYSINPNPPSEYLLPSQWVPVLYLITLNQSASLNLSDMRHSTLDIGAGQLRSVTEIAPKSPFLHVNRSLTSLNLIEINLFS